ncbi:hypothetical protein VSS92_29180, partial [Pseudomonas syringae pv. tagetis]
MLYVSHSPAEVARIATTVVMLEAGRVTRMGPAAEVLADPTAADQAPLTALFERQQNLLGLLRQRRDAAAAL